MLPPHEDTKSNAASAESRLFAERKLQFGCAGMQKEAVVANERKFSFRRKNEETETKKSQVKTRPEPPDQDKKTR